MAFKPKDYLRHAEDLLLKCRDLPNSESKLRSACHCTYYSVMLHGRKIAGLANDKHDIHRKVMEHFREYENRELNFKFKYTHKLRIKSDYNLSVSVRRGEAMRAIKFSKRVIDLMDECAKRPKPPKSSRPSKVSRRRSRRQRQNT